MKKFVKQCVAVFLVVATMCSGLPVSLVQAADQQTADDVFLSGGCYRRHYRRHIGLYV